MFVTKAKCGKNNFKANNITNATVEYLVFDSDTVNLNVTAKGRGNSNRGDVKKNASPAAGWPSRNTTFGYMLEQIDGIMTGNITM